MKICMPISEDRGLESPLCEHFGSAPAFLLVDTETQARKVFTNDHVQHEHGHCAPIAQLAEEQVEAFVVGGIGAGALARLQAMGAVVYRGRPGPAAQSLEALARKELAPLSPADTCGHHHHHGG
jgi:predicted Fe-Mo cluster-binding NifX family protein